MFCFLTQFTTTLSDRGTSRSSTGSSSIWSWFNTSDSASRGYFGCGCGCVWWFQSSRWCSLDIRPLSRMWLWTRRMREKKDEWSARRPTSNLCSSFSNNSSALCSAASTYGFVVSWIFWMYYKSVRSWSNPRCSSIIVKHCSMRRDPLGNLKNEETRSTFGLAAR